MLGVFSWIVLEIIKTLIKFGVIIGLIGLLVFIGYPYLVE